MATEEDIVADLLGNSTVKRRKAAKAAQEIGLKMCDVLSQSLVLEFSSKHWQTKAELIRVLGVLGCSSAAMILRDFVFSRHQPEFDLVRREASKALIRVSRKGLDDCQTIWEIINFGGYSITEGALEAIGYDKMIFDIETCTSLIERCWDFGKERTKGYTDPRYGLAAGCAGWNNDVSHKFLIHCLESDDGPLRYVTENSLRGKYVRLR